MQFAANTARNVEEGGFQQAWIVYQYKHDNIVAFQSQVQYNYLVTDANRISTIQDKSRGSQLHVRALMATWKSSIPI